MINTLALETDDQYFSTRNWTYQFSGGKGGSNNVPINSNTIKVVIQVNEAKCADAGLYYCNASYIQNKNDLKSYNLYNVTSKGIDNILIFTKCLRNCF